MKTAKHLFLILALISTVSCSAIKTEVTNTTQENTNVEQNSANSEIANQNSFVESEEPVTGTRQMLPDALIRDLYKTHEKNYSGILNRKNRAGLDKYFDKNLANLIWKDITADRDEAGVLDFDPFYNTQDPDIKNLSVGSGKIEGAKAAVPVTFTNAGTKETLTYLLVQQNSVWKISDIKYRDGASLLKYFKEDAQNNVAESSSREGNFEGVYQVGETTATVKPTKMAFELKWAKGSGTMIFHYAGRGVLEYTSEDKGNGSDTFIFNDTTFTTGKFIRADGKEMPVKKIK